MRGAVRGDRAFNIVNHVFLTVVLVAVLYPLVYILSSSISDVSAVISGRVWLLPVGLNVGAYEAVVNYPGIWRAYANSVFYTAGGAGISLVLTILAAYPLSRADFKARNFYMFVFTFTMLFNGGLIPFYMVVRNLKMINTRWAMFLPYALSVWNVIITRTYYQQTISKSLLEAAQIDGCKDFRFVVSVVVPLSGAITAVNLLFYGVFKWNSYFDAFLLLSDVRLMPLQIFLRRILIANTFDESVTTSNAAAFMSEQGRQAFRELIKYALIIFASLPVFLIYPFVQRYFVKGVMIGSLKG